MKLPSDSYYADRPVLHTAQGDLHSEVPIAVAYGEVEGRKRSRGARKRPLGFLRPDPQDAGAHARTVELAIVCSYTCGFVAQPPGQEGYSHPLRLVAPVVRLSELVNSRGMQRTEARKLKDSGFLAGLLYLPRPPGFTPNAKHPADDEFTADDYAVCMYAMASVHQSVLDNAPRVARMSLEAQKLLVAGLIGEVAPNYYNPDSLEDPDMSCSWSGPGGATPSR
jgi:hypothetical protein